MKKPQRQTGELDDADIGALFEQQSLEPPEAVDVAIFAAAQNVVKQQADFTEDEFAGPSHKYTFWYQFAATAAVLVLAVTLVPTLTQTPEYKRDNSPVTAGVASEDVSVEAVRKAETAAENLARTMRKSKLPVADHAMEPVPMWQGAPEPQVDTERAGSQINAPITSSFSSGVSESKTVDSRYNVTEVETDGDVDLMELKIRLRVQAQEVFRQSPVKWTREIIRLHDADELADAKREYVLFKKMYPELATDSRFPKKLRKPGK